MKIYNTTKGILVAHEDLFYRIDDSWDTFINNENIYRNTLSKIGKLTPVEEALEHIEHELLPPVGSQEIWASGVTYMRSKSARMEEAKVAGGGDFYDRVYEAERPELFFKAPGYRAVGSGKKVRIRNDSAWNVPEPELTLMISASGKIIGYTIGNDMSSRDIEGANPLYLPQAKTYDGSAAIGPCILVRETPLPGATAIAIEITRKGSEVFSDTIAISRIKREFKELVGFLYREMSFPSGCLLMTGTGIVPPNDFTLHPGDEIRITVKEIGTLVNTVA